MADRESIGVGAAYREMYGFVAEAQALVEVMDQRPSEGSCADILAGGCLTRLCDAVDRYVAVLRAAGVEAWGGE